jgi:hypothetical protein
MKSKRSLWIQFRYTTRHGIGHSSMGTPYSNLANAIKEAQRLNADRVYDTAARRVVWERSNS